MNAVDRREKIEHLLRSADSPLSASSIAASFEVSRQIIVGDIALMRAGGLNILATPRGYILQSEEANNACFERSVACIHGAEDLREEIYTIIDHGGALIDVTVSHSIYGEISAPLHLFSRYDADIFLRKLSQSNANPLSALTGGVHLHRIRCADEATFDRVARALHEKGYIFSE